MIYFHMIKVDINIFDVLQTVDVGHYWALLAFKSIVNAFSDSKSHNLQAQLPTK